MKKFHGYIGYKLLVEKEPGIWVDDINEVEYYGDIIRDSSNQVNSGGVNDNIRLNNRISILADPYAFENFQHIKYIIFMGNKWKISEIEVSYPRLIIGIGDIYNE